MNRLLIPLYLALLLLMMLLSFLVGEWLICIGHLENGDNSGFASHAEIREECWDRVLIPFSALWPTK